MHCHPNLSSSIDLAVTIWASGRLSSATSHRCHSRVFIVVIYFTLRFPSREGYGLAYRQPRISCAFVWTARMLRDYPCGPLGTAPFAGIFIGFIVLLPLSPPAHPFPFRFRFRFLFLFGLDVRSRNERARDPRRLRSLEVLLEFVSATRNGASDRACLARSVNFDLGNLNAVLLRRPQGLRARTPSPDCFLRRRSRFPLSRQVGFMFLLVIRDIYGFYSSIADLESYS